MSSTDAERSLPRWFSATRDASHSIVARFHPEPPPPTIFHYTSTAALISIVEHDELWLSDATFLNDRAEIEHGRQVARTCLEAATKWEGDAEAKELMRYALALFDATPNPAVYIACFSFQADDLPQWRGYSQGSVPVAIEIEHGPLMFGYTSEGLLQQVLYEVDEQRWTFDQLLHAYWDAYTQDILNPMPGRDTSPDDLRYDRQFCAEKLYFDLWRYIIACKDPAFAAEREVRFTYTAHHFTGLDWPQHPEPRFRTLDGRIIPYLSSKNLHFRNTEPVREAPPLPIRSVRIGPTAEPALIERGVRRLLDEHGHSTASITHSECPFRPC